GKSGSYMVTGVSRKLLDDRVRELSVAARATNGDARSIAVPRRIALFKASPGIIDEGWTEWLLDSYGFDYTLITPEDLRAGNLSSRFDVIVMGSQAFGRSPGRRGRRERGARTDSAAFAAAVRGVDEFVRGGGTVVVWSQG